MIGGQSSAQRPWSHRGCRSRAGRGMPPGRSGEDNPAAPPPPAHCRSGPSRGAQAPDAQVPGPLPQPGSARRNVLTERNTDRKIPLHVKGISSIRCFLIACRWFEMSASEPRRGILGRRAERRGPDLVSGKGGHRGTGVPAPAGTGLGTRGPGTLWPLSEPPGPPSSTGRPPRPGGTAHAPSPARSGGPPPGQFGGGPQPRLGTREDHPPRVELRRGSGGSGNEERWHRTWELNPFGDRPGHWSRPAGPPGFSVRCGEPRGVVLN